MRNPSSATFSGAVTTTGKSEALRLEKSFFRAHPEFRQRARVRAHVIGHGHILVALDEPLTEDAEDIDPVASAYLAFLEQDMIARPDGLRPFIAEEVDELDSLLEGVTVDDTEALPDDVTI